MSIKLPGLASGLDSAALIDQLMSVEAVPQQLLRRQVNTTNVFTDALRELNSRTAALADTATAASGATALQHHKVGSSSDTVTAVATHQANPGSLSFTVEQTATRHAVVTDPITEWDSSSFQIIAADGTTTDITAASTSLDDIVAAINSSESGVAAAKIAVGEGSYRLQLSAAETGADAVFSLAGTQTGSTVTSQGQDAVVELWAGTGAQTRITSSSNTFSDLLPGVDVTVSEATTSPVTLTVEQDAEASTAEAKKLISGVQNVLGFISRQSAVNVDGDEVSASVLTGDSTVRMARSRITDAVIMPVAGESLSKIGIEISRTGEITFDEEKFAAALEEDPQGTQGLFTAMAARVTDVATGLSDRYEGDLTRRITGQETTIRRLEDQVLQWDTRLAARRATLERTYAALEVQMQALNSQMEYLTSQLASLPQPPRANNN